VLSLECCLRAPEVLPPRDDVRAPRRGNRAARDAEQRGAARDALRRRARPAPCFGAIGLLVLQIS